MIGIDTSILLRLKLNDDRAQNKRIDMLLAAHGGMPGSLPVTDVVLAEAVWTLGSALEQHEHAHLIAIRSLLEETAFAFDDREAVATALCLFDAGSCGFADCLVVATHARHGLQIHRHPRSRHAEAARSQGALTVQRLPWQKRRQALHAPRYRVVCSRRWRLHCPARKKGWDKP